jgi:heme A synthase
MYPSLLLAHSYVRYLVFIFLIIVIAMALAGMMGKKPYGKPNNLFGLLLLIFTHLQALLGFIVYFVSPNVRFGSDTMKDAGTRYWTVEHLTGMLIAVVLITVARSTSKRMTDDAAKHKRLFIFNLLALLIIVATIYAGHFGIFYSRFL